MQAEQNSLALIEDSYINNDKSVDQIRIALKVDWLDLPQLEFS